MKGTRKHHPDLRQQIADADNLYEQYVRDAGLFGQAFFGHATTDDEQRTLDWCWLRAEKEAGLT